MTLWAVFFFLPIYKNHELLEVRTVDLLVVDKKTNLTSQCLVDMYHRFVRRYKNILSDYVFSCGCYLYVEVEVAQPDSIREIRPIRSDPNSIRSDFLRKSN
jgi:hypothetical protein